MTAIGGRLTGARRTRRGAAMPAADKLVLAGLLGLPLLLDLLFIWAPAVSSVVLSFTRWNGIGGLHTRACSPPPAPSILQNGCWYGVQNYHQAATIYPPFWPAVLHNVIWLAVFLLIATPLGVLLPFSSTRVSGAAGSTRVSCSFRSCCRSR